MITPAGFQSQCCRKILNHICPHSAQASAAETRRSSQPLCSPSQAVGWTRNFILTSQMKGTDTSPSVCYGLTAPSLCKQCVQSTKSVSLQQCSHLLQVSFHCSYFLPKLDSFFRPVWVWPNLSKSWKPTDSCSVAVFLHALTWLYQWIVIWIDYPVSAQGWFRCLRVRHSHMSRHFGNSSAHVTSVTASFCSPEN